MQISGNKNGQNRYKFTNVLSTFIPFYASVQLFFNILPTWNQLITKKITVSNQSLSIQNNRKKYHPEKNNNSCIKKRNDHEVMDIGSQVLKKVLLFGSGQVGEFDWDGSQAMKHWKRKCKCNIN